MVLSSRKKTRNKPSDATDRFRCAAYDFNMPSRPIASPKFLLSAGYPSWREHSTPKRQDYCKPKMFITCHFLFVTAGAGGCLAMGKPHKLQALSPPPAAALRQSGQAALAADASGAPSAAAAPTPGPRPRLAAPTRAAEMAAAARCARLPVNGPSWSTGRVRGSKPSAVVVL